jgi:PAS domain S-box-containing protein
LGEGWGRQAVTTFDETFEIVAASLPELRGNEFEALLASATHVARNAVCITDAELDDPGPRIVYVNPAFERMTGYSAEEVLGRNPRFLQGPDSDRRVLDRLRADLEAGRPFQGETFNYRKDGTPFTMAWRIAAVRDRHGEVTHYVAAQDDLSLLRAAEGKLRTLANQLQGALLPDLPALPELDLAWRYRPVADHALVGGDWYDAVRLPSGSIALFLGDMVGHGDEAAALMGEFRFTCRGLVRAWDVPGTILQELEHAILANHRPGQALATMVAAVIDPDGTLHYSVAGHPAPVVRRSDGSIEMLDRARARLLGASTTIPARSTATDHLDPGDVLVLFSDGAFEHRSAPFDVTYAGLLDRLAAADPTPTGLCVAAISTAEAEPVDDIVVLAATPIGT